jgi:hypothetical protein
MSPRAIAVAEANGMVGRHLVDALLVRGVARKEELAETRRAATRSV